LQQGGLGQFEVAGLVGGEPEHRGGLAYAGKQAGLPLGVSPGLHGGGGFVGRIGSAVALRLGGERGGEPLPVKLGAHARERGGTFAGDAPRFEIRPLREGDIEAWSRGR
jgi:hypothetical protein